jgi:hypothetical protein
VRRELAIFELGTPSLSPAPLFPNRRPFLLSQSVPISLYTMVGTISRRFKCLHLIIRLILGPRDDKDWRLVLTLGAMWVSAFSTIEPRIALHVCQAAAMIVLNYPLASNPGNEAGVLITSHLSCFMSAGAMIMPRWMAVESANRRGIIWVVLSPACEYSIFTMSVQCFEFSQGTCS